MTMETTEQVRKGQTEEKEDVTRLGVPDESSCSFVEGAAPTVNSDCLTDDILSLILPESFPSKMSTTDSSKSAFSSVTTKCTRFDMPTLELQFPFQFDLAQPQLLSTTEKSENKPKEEEKLQDKKTDKVKAAPKKKRSYFRRSQHSKEAIAAFEERKKMQKRERNRILAAESRKRQKQEMASLRSQNAELIAQNEQVNYHIIRLQHQLSRTLERLSFYEDTGYSLSLQKF